MNFRFRRSLLVLLVLGLLVSVICVISIVNAYAAWQPNTWYNVGDMVTYGGNDYKCIQAHTSLVGWEPPVVPALWQLIGPSVSSTPSQTATKTPSKTPTRSITPSVEPPPPSPTLRTPTATKTPTPTKTLTQTITPSSSVTPTITRTPSPTQTPTSSTKTVYAGVRESKYGVTECLGYFPAATGWTTATMHMVSHWAGGWAESYPRMIWLVGEVDFGTTGTTLQFTQPAGTYDPLIAFDPSGVDHEGCFTYFDSAGYKVFLQLEPGFASVTDQINAVLTKFGSHPCVAGLAIDVEWYKNASDGGVNAPVSDALAQQWESLVRSYNSNFRLLLKHFDESYLPPTYRGQIIFCCDDEANGDLTTFLAEHKRMANFCYPNPVFYQIGYPSDKSWWSVYLDPPKELGTRLLMQTPTAQPCGIIWVDFSLDVLPH